MDDQTKASAGGSLKGHGGPEAGHAGHAHMNDMAKPPRIENMAHQHALILVGTETLFGVHMTQYHTEEHKYQLILELDFADPKVKAAVLEERNSERRDMPVVLCNHPEESPGDGNLFTIPQLASQARPEFLGDVFLGLPPFTPEEEATPHFFPWSLGRVRPIAGKVEVRIKRQVMFRPFAHNEIMPEFANYYLWGRGDEAHLTHLQTAALATGRFDVPAFGPDYDHVMSLKERPDWLSDAMLEAGIVMSAPAARLRDPETWEPDIPTSPPFVPGKTIELLYRGMPPVYRAVAGETYLFGSAVSCSESQIPPMKKGGQPLFMAGTPAEWLLKGN